MVATRASIRRKESADNARPPYQPPITSHQSLLTSHPAVPHPAVRPSLFRLRSPIRQHDTTRRFTESGELFFGNHTEIPDSAQLHQCGRTSEIVKSTSNFSVLLVNEFTNLESILRMG